jgi:hypothetical protein
MTHDKPNSIAMTDAAAIVKGADTNTAGSRAALQRLLAGDPARAEAIVTATGLAAHAESAALDYAASHSDLLHELLPRELAELRARLACPGDGALEQLLIERIALTWLVLTTAEHRRASLWLADSVPRANAEFLDHRVARLSSDFLRACRALATTRRLLVPAIRQLNITQQQVNLVPASSEEEPGK